jgi:hypothetical protein
VEEEAHGMGDDEDYKEVNVESIDLEDRDAHPVVAESKKRKKK